MKFNHIPIMLNQCMEMLNINNGIYVDATVGGGGHSEKILTLLDGKGSLIAIDKDIEAINASKIRLQQFSNVKFVNDDYTNISQILQDLSIDKVDGILIDLGISSYQIDNKERGFSYMGGDELLDMRMNQSQQLSAETVVNEYDEYRLYQIIRDYGEDKFAKNIAKNICIERQNGRITTCRQLVDIIDKSIPYKEKRRGGHPAKKTFQALRIEVNGELDRLEATLRAMVDRLNSKGRLVVLTFHSLEDRIVKQVFTDLATDCICSKELPICVCDHRQQVKLLAKKPIVPTIEELNANSRSASCKLRAIEKI